MTLQTTPAEREELKRLEAAATPGPWVSECQPNGICAAMVYSDTIKAIGKYPHLRVVDRPGYDCGGKKETYQTMMLIAAARNALPRLLADIEALVAENERLKDERDEFDICPKCGHEFKVKP